MKMRESTLPRTVSPRFEVTPTCTGYEVSDMDGRPVTEEFDAEWQATKAANLLNDAAKDGPDSLAFALGAIDEAELLGEFV